MLSKSFVALVVVASMALSVAPLPAQEPKVTIAISGWTGFAPLSLAEKTGLFKKHGVKTVPDINTIIDTRFIR